MRMIFYSVQHDASKQTEPVMERHGDLMWESERTGKDMRVISRERNSEGFYIYFGDFHCGSLLIYQWLCWYLKEAGERNLLL